MWGGNIVQTQHGEWWAPYICQRRIDGFSTLGRETAIDPVNWTEDGWPVVNNKKGPSDINLIPNLPTVAFEKKSLDDFNERELGMHWLFVRNPDYANYSLEERAGHLRIYATDYDLDNIKARNVILQRETSHNFVATTKLEFKPSQNGEQAGLLCYYDTTSYIKCALTYKDGLKVIVEKNGEKEKAIVAEKEIQQVSNIYLKVSVDKHQRTFYYSLDEKTWEVVGTVERATYLSDEGTMNWGFTGTMIGVFATNNGTKNKVFADFDWFKKEYLTQ